MKKALLSVWLSFVFLSLTCGLCYALEGEPTAQFSGLTQANVFQKEKFAKGGKLLVVPFTPGENVPAGDELDHISLMIVKGIADTLGPYGQPFKILTAQEAHEADFVIKGRIVELEEKKPFLKPWGRKLRRYRLKVEGNVLDVIEDEVLAKFSQTKKAQSQKNCFSALGYEIGVQIGRFLVDNASMKE